MAKISDITDWLVSVRGDEGQVRSLVKLLRADGQFSSSGRGRGSPDMVADDFATALVCALTTTLTTHVPMHVREIFALKIFSVNVDSGNGAGFQDYTVWDGADELPSADEFGNRMLPPEFSSCPDTLGNALSAWTKHFAENPAEGVMNWDRISLHVGANVKVEFELYNPNWMQRGWGSDDGDYSRYAWKLQFEAYDTNIDLLRRSTVTTIYNNALRALAELARRDDAPSPVKE